MLVMCIRFLLCVVVSFASIAVAKSVANVKSFGRTPAGDEVSVYTLANSNGLSAKVIDYGAMLVSIVTPDKDGKLDDVTLGFDTMKEYFNRNFGGVTGRFANRIGGAKFTLDGIEHNVTRNAGQNHIHGGRKGFSKVLWKGEAFCNEKVAGVRLTYLSRDGEEGYPGNLKSTVTYTLNDKNELAINYVATSDKPTVVNLTNHAYFNLTGAGTGDIRDHVATIYADNYTLADKSLIPTGEIASVKGTPLDFTEPAKIGARIDELPRTKGYDHNFVFTKEANELALAARIYDPRSGRVMEVLTTEPGMQFYTANHVRNLKGRDGKIYGQHAGFCVETQHYPDSPNKPNFPTTTLRPGEAFNSTTIFKFSTRTP